MARYHLAAQAAAVTLSAWSGQPADAQRIRFQLDAPVQAGRSFFEMVTFMLAELRRLRADGFQEDWEEFVSTDRGFNEVTARSTYRFVSELYLAALLYYTTKFGDANLRQAKDLLFKWAYSLRTSNLSLYFRTVNKYAKDPETDRSAFVLLRNAEAASDLRSLVVEVKGRPERPGHQQKLLDVLNDLEA
jgi:hypothetical protein